jgi:hypothetical protein
LQQKLKGRALIECIQNAPSISRRSNGAWKFRRSSCNIAKIVAIFLHNVQKAFNIRVQNIIMEKIVFHDFNDVMPPYMHDFKRLKHNQ